MEVSVSANVFARRKVLEKLSELNVKSRTTGQADFCGPSYSGWRLSQLHQPTLLFGSSFSLRQNKDLLIFNLKLQLLGLSVANRSVLGGMSKVISTIINIIINTTINIITCNLDSGHE